MILRLAGEEETLRLAARLAKRARGGDVLCLAGPLGSGKSTFARGFLRALGHKGEAPSPTFALVHEYPRLKPRVYHLDLFRLDEKEAAGLGLEEYLDDPRAVCLIEWPVVAGRFLPRDRLEISFSYAGRAAREVRLRPRGPRSRRLSS